HHLGPNRLAHVDDIRARLLRGRNDADVDAALRCGAFRLCATRFSAAVGRDHRRGHADQQNGSGVSQDLRSHAGTAICDLHGILCERRWLLSLFLFGGPWLRSYRAGRHLRAGLSADCRSASLRRSAPAEENPPYRDHRAVNGGMDESLDQLRAMLAREWAGSVRGHEVARGELTVTVNAGDLVKLPT